MDLELRIKIHQPASPKNTKENMKNLIHKLTQKAWQNEAQDAVNSIRDIDHW